MFQFIYFFVLQQLNLGYRHLRNNRDSILISFFTPQVSETEINGQFESVCESVFSEVESQAMEALDLPGCFRTRSHSYLRAIQAGYSQDDDCIPPMASTVTSTIRSTTGRVENNCTVTHKKLLVAGIFVCAYNMTVKAHLWH